MRILTSTHLTPDHYSFGHRSPAFEIANDNVTLDLSGSVIEGSDRRGVGIYVHDCENVTIRGGVVRGFHQGIRVENVRVLNIERCVISDNHNPTGAGWLPDTFEPNESGFGGGIHLFQVVDASIDRCSVTGNFNGVDMVNCERIAIRDTDASHSGNVGFHLLGSSYCIVSDSRAEHCIRFTDRFWNDTADSAGILIEEFSDHNQIVGNSLRYSGDGLFIRANNRHASNGNYIARNDGSFSPNNAFEAVFCEGNVFEENVANYSNYGFWLGYSRNTTVRRNRIEFNRLDGIAIEHGSGNTIESNRIRGNRDGIRLWCDPSDLGDDPSADYTIRSNAITESRRTGISLSNTSDVTMEGNAMSGNPLDISEN